MGKRCFTTSPFYLLLKFPYLVSPKLKNHEKSTEILPPPGHFDYCIL